MEIELWLKLGKICLSWSGGLYFYGLRFGGGAPLETHASGGISHADWFALPMHKFTREDRFADIVGRGLRAIGSRSPRISLQTWDKQRSRACTVGCQEGLLTYY